MCVLHFYGSDLVVLISEDNKILWSGSQSVESWSRSWNLVLVVCLVFKMWLFVTLWISVVRVLFWGQFSVAWTWSLC